MHLNIDFCNKKCKIYLGDKNMKNSLQIYSYKTNNKCGISLIVLIITIIITLILIATTAISAAKSIDNANITTFARDLDVIQESIESYYVINNIIPLLADSSVMNKDELVTIARSQDIILDELTENDDLDSQFYTIDLSKINVTKIAYGNKKLGENDIFVMAYPSMTVYYPYGLNANSTMYFSITSKISNNQKIVQNETDVSITSVISSGLIKVTKTNGLANKMGVNIEVDIASDESLYMSVSSDPNRLITTIIGKNTFGFDSLSSIVNDTETIKVPTLTQAEANYIELGIKPLAERYVDILKYKNSEIIGRTRIDLSNFSNTLPTITSATLSSYTGMNTVNLVLANNDNGIKEVRYEYLTKFSEDGTIVNYYNDVTDFDSLYMANKAKKAKLANDLTTVINAPKNVRSIKVAIIDNIGNVNLYNQIIAPNLYIGYTVNTATTLSLQLTANMYSSNGIKTISFSKSTDGINFTDEQVYTLNTTINGVTTKQNLAYKVSSVNKVYIKMVAVNYDNTITETRIVIINIEQKYQIEIANKPILYTGMTAIKWNGSTWVTVSDPDTDTSWYNYSNKEWANAQTADGSMWVWIPRYVYKISNLWHTASTSGGTINTQFSDGTNDNWNVDVIGSLNTDTGAIASNNTWTNHPGFTFGSTELTGIWVAKFQASGTISAVNILPAATALRSTTISSVFTACRNMETTYGTRYGWGTSGTGIDVHLMKNVEWGAVAYLAQSKYGKNTTEVAINTSSTVTGGGTGTVYVINISQSTTGNIYGIYDMSGNTYEYTAAYINNGNTNLTKNGVDLVNVELKYKDLYTITTDSQVNNYNNAVNKKGDAIYETSGSYSGSNSWFSDFSTMPNGNSPFFAMGGLNSSTTSAGCFSFYSYTGASSTSYGFRPVLLVSTEL